MTELIQVVGVVGLLIGTWKLDAINRTLGRIESTLENHKEDLRDHDGRISQLERDRHRDPPPVGYVGRNPAVAQS